MAPSAKAHPTALMQEAGQAGRGQTRPSKSVGDGVGLGSGWEANSWVRDSPSEGYPAKCGHDHDAAAMQTGWDPRTQSLSLKRDPVWMAGEERPHWVPPTFCLGPAAVSQGTSCVKPPGGAEGALRALTWVETVLNHFCQAEGVLLCYCCVLVRQLTLLGALFAGLTLCQKQFTGAAALAQRMCPLRAASFKGF